MAGAFVINHGSAVTVSSINFSVMADLIQTALGPDGEVVFARSFDPYIDGYMDSAYFVDLSADEFGRMLKAVTSAKQIYLANGYEAIPAWDRLSQEMGADDRSASAR